MHRTKNKWRPFELSFPSRMLFGEIGCENYLWMLYWLQKFIALLSYWYLNLNENRHICKIVWNLISPLELMEGWNELRVLFAHSIFCFLVNGRRKQFYVLGVYYYLIVSICYKLKYERRGNCVKYFERKWILNW